MQIIATDIRVGAGRRESEFRCAGPVSCARPRKLHPGLSVGLCLESEVNLLVFFASNGDIYSPSAVVLVPCGDVVLTRRQVRQAERARISTDVVVRGLQYSEPAMHPGMDVALHRDEFGLVIFFLDRWPTWRLGFIPLIVLLREGMNVVRSLVIVDNLKFLPDVHRQNM